MSRATDTVLLYQGDDWTKLEDLRIEAEAARQRHAEAKKSPTRRGGDDTATPLADAEKAFDDFVDEAAERAQEVVVQSLGRKAFRDMRMDHKPRMTTRLIDGDETEIPIPEDALFRVNTDTFPDVLLTYVDATDPELRTIVKPEFNSKAELRAWLDEDLTEGQYDDIWRAAHALNAQGAPDLKALKYQTTSSEMSG